MDTTPSSSALYSALLEIREALLRQDEQAARSSVGVLADTASPQVVMDHLAPLLFAPDVYEPNLSISSEDALLILGLLIAVNSDKYLSAASLAVRNQALKRSKAPGAPMKVSPELLAVIVQQLSSGMTGVSSHAEETLVACCQRLGVEGFGATALQSLVAAWRRAWNGDDVDRNRKNPSRSEASIICVRCATCIAQIAALGDDFMRAALSCGAMTLILQLLGEETDVLLEMASLDILEQLITVQPMHEERAQWLYSDAVLLPLLEMAGGMEETVPDPTLGGSALRVLSQLCKLSQLDPQLFGRGGEYLLKGFHQALQNFEVAGELDRLAKVDAISSFASASPDALRVILDDANIREDWLSLSVAQSKLKASILHSIALVLDPPTMLDSNGDMISNVTVASLDDTTGRRLYFTIGQVNKEEPTRLILGLASSPLPEIRLGAYALLIGVAKLPTGPQILFGDPQFLEFLLARPPLETTKEGRETRYALVETIHKSNIMGLLADNIVKRIEKHLSQGAHFVEAVTWELATEE